MTTEAQSARYTRRYAEHIRRHGSVAVGSMHPGMRSMHTGMRSMHEVMRYVHSTSESGHVKDMNQGKACLA